MLNNRVVKQAFMKPLLYFIPFLLVACQHNSSYTMKDSLFIGKLLPGDTLKIVNEKNYCEDGPFSETYNIYYVNQSDTLRCDLYVEIGWTSIGKQFVEKRVYEVSPKTLKKYLTFEKDVIDNATGADENGCTFFEFFDIILNKDTISSSHTNCNYQGFGDFCMELEKNLILE